MKKSVSCHSLWQDFFCRFFYVKKIGKNALTGIFIWKILLFLSFAIKRYIIYSN